MDHWDNRMDQWKEWVISGICGWIRGRSGWIKGEEWVD